MVELRWVFSRGPLEQGSISVGDIYQPMFQKLQYRVAVKREYIDWQYTAICEHEWSDWKDVPIVWEDS